MWVVYFIVGFVLAIYVFMVFFDSLSTLFEHDALQKKKDFRMPGDEDQAGKEGKP